MTRKQEAKNVLNSLGMPTRQQSDICCLSLLALLNLSPSTSWSVATNEWRRIHDLSVIAYLREQTGRSRSALGGLAQKVVDPAITAASFSVLAKAIS